MTLACDRFMILRSLAYGEDPHVFLLAFSNIQHGYDHQMHCLALKQIDLQVEYSSFDQKSIAMQLDAY